MNPDTITMTMAKTKETKGTVVFTESDADVQEAGRDRPHTFYILKDAYREMGEPSTVDVTITPVA